MMVITNSQVDGLIRWGVGAALAYAVGHGWVAASSVGGIVSLAAVIGVAVWSWYSNSATALAAAAKVKNV